MRQKIFKIYDGRNIFWQWDVGQKLIVLDEAIVEVHFTNKDMKKSIKRTVYEDSNGIKVCDVPDSILQYPREVIAYGHNKIHTINSMIFGVIPKQKPEDYTPGPDDDLHDIYTRLEILEQAVDEIEKNGSINDLPKFSSTTEASAWAQEQEKSGFIVLISIDSKWIAHVIEDDYSVTPICDDNEEAIEIDILDGGGPAGL